MSRAKKNKSILSTNRAKHMIVAERIIVRYGHIVELYTKTIDDTSHYVGLHRVSTVVSFHLATLRRHISRMLNDPTKLAL